MELAARVLPFDLFGKTVLLVGFGRIGSRTAKRCLAMEMEVLVYDPYKSAEEITARGCKKVGDLDAALAARRFRQPALSEERGDRGDVRRRAAVADEADARI